VIKLLTDIKTISFPDTVNLVNGNCQSSTGAKSINECLGLLLTSSKGEFLGDPDFGTNIHRYIFDHNGVAMVEIVKEEILNAVRAYMPRVQMTEDDIQIEQNDNYVEITLSYSLRNSNINDEYSLVYLKDGSEEIVY